MSGQAVLSSHLSGPASADPAPRVGAHTPCCRAGLWSAGCALALPWTTSQGPHALPGGATGGVASLGAPVSCPVWLLLGRWRLRPGPWMVGRGSWAQPWRGRRGSAGHPPMFLSHISREEKLLSRGSVSAPIGGGAVPGDLSLRGLSASGQQLCLLLLGQNVHLSVHPEAPSSGRL